MSQKNISRRNFLKILGAGTVAATAATLTGCRQKDIDDNAPVKIEKGKMTYRTNPKTGDKVSLLGFGMMRLPVVEDNAPKGASGRESTAPIDQEMVNRLVDRAIEYGVNYFDTSPAYCQGRSESSTGIALSRHKRSEYYIATKLSNFAPETWSRKASIEMFQNSLKELRVDYIDYLLLHSVGGGEDGMDTYRKRYVDNDILDYLLEQREKGVIRNLGFSYHGDIKVFDYLLSRHDEYKWDFVQIEMNYLDWHFAKKINERNTNADYLYNELEKRNIPAVIMEPLLGGRLANVPDNIVRQMKAREPQRSVASWAFRFCGTYPNVLTSLSGMNRIEHLDDNLASHCPLKPLTKEELDFLEDIAQKIYDLKTIPCNECQYCMPCPYGLDIPAIFSHYNRCIKEGNLAKSMDDSDYKKMRKAFLVGYDRSVPKLRQASHCVHCGECVSHCPQRIPIPAQMQMVDEYVEKLKQNTLGQEI